MSYFDRFKVIKPWPGGHTSSMSNSVFKILGHHVFFFFFCEYTSYCHHFLSDSVFGLVVMRIWLWYSICWPTVYLFLPTIFTLSADCIFWISLSFKSLYLHFHRLWLYSRFLKINLVILDTGLPIVATFILFLFLSSLKWHRFYNRKSSQLSFVICSKKLEFF